MDDLIIPTKHHHMSVSSSHSAFPSLFFTNYVNSAYSFTDHHIYPIRKIMTEANGQSIPPLQVNEFFSFINFFFFFLQLHKNVPN